MSGASRATQALRVGYRRLVRPALFRVGGGDPEAVHELMIDALARVPARAGRAAGTAVEVAGIRFPNRVGLAAGLDKDGRAAGAWRYFGFGFAELGTVTGHAQPGNDRPRLFRLKQSEAIINRMGFNNAGAAALGRRLRALGVSRGNGAVGIPLGISIGKTKLASLTEAVADYLISLREIHDVADYVAINVSSPNTPGLRSLQGARELADLLSALTTEAAALDDTPVPIFVKLAPDLAPDDLADTLAVVRASGVAGVIATNTTLSREGLHPADAATGAEAGGLSGRPLTARALAFVESLAGQTDLPVMGVGGIMSPGDAARMFDAGASLVQLYTGFIYEGPALVRGINDLQGNR